MSYFVAEGAGVRGLEFAIDRLYTDSLLCTPDALRDHQSLKAIPLYYLLNVFTVSTKVCCCTFSGVLKLKEHLGVD